jgi:hypothetical protein
MVGWFRGAINKLKYEGVMSLIKGALGLELFCWLKKKSRGRKKSLKKHRGLD